MKVHIHHWPIMRKNEFSWVQNKFWLLGEDLVGEVKTPPPRMLAWTSLAVHRGRLCTSTVAGTGLIPGGGAKILHATQQKKKKKVGPRIRFLSFLFTADHLVPKDNAYNRRAPESLLSGCCRNFNMVPALSSLPEQRLLLKAWRCPWLHPGI